MMADNLEYIVSRERCHGRVLAFAHNSRLQRGKAQWQLGPDLLIWWSAGAQLHEIFGPCYADIGTAVSVFEGNGLSQPEAGALEARLTAVPVSGWFIPTNNGQGLSASEITSLPVRSGSMNNMTYFSLTH